MLGIKRQRPAAPMAVDRPSSQLRGGIATPSGPTVRAGTLTAYEEPFWPMPLTPVTELTTLSLPAAWRCSQLIANGIGILNMYAIDDRSGHEDRIDPTPSVLADPWPLVSPMNWKTQVVMSMLLHGNAYCVQADPDPANGYPRQLPVIPPDTVRVEVVDGVPIYWVQEAGPYGPLDILHFRGPMLPGEPAGMGLVEIHRRALGYAVDLDNYGSATFSQGAVPPIILHINRPELSREQAEDIQARWMAAHGFGQRTPAVLPNSITAETVAFSPEDAEYLQSRVQSATEVCWIFGVDPRLLALPGGQGSLTYSNLEMAQSEMARDSFMPWTTRIEQVMSWCLPRHIIGRFDFAAMLRPTTVDRYTAYKVAIETGFKTINECRADEDLGPIEEAPGYEPPQPVPAQLAAVQPIANEEVAQ